MERVTGIEPAFSAWEADLVVVGVRWIVNTNPWSGPTVLSLSTTHGVHLNDWVSFVLWAVALLVAAPRASLVGRSRRCCVAPTAESARPLRGAAGAASALH
jgi:Na+/H+ antiporter NhaC